MTDSPLPSQENNVHGKIQIKLEIIMESLHTVEKHAKQSQEFKLCPLGNKKSL
jgi:hypothetical protein